MPQVILTPSAVRDLHRLRDFLATKDVASARRAVGTIAKALAILEEFPTIARPFEREPLFRELVIEFGNAGYLALYEYNPILADEVRVVAIRHQLEHLYGFEADDEPGAPLALNLTPSPAPRWLSRVDPAWAGPLFATTGHSLSSNGFDTLWRLPPSKPIPNWRCRRRPEASRSPW